MSRKSRPPRRKAPAYQSYLKWTAALVIVGGLIYAGAQNTGVAYDENDIRVVSFFGLSDGQKLDALRAANRERCSCGCGMNLAQCVATDMTCPLREGNIDKIRGMVAQAKQGS